jgi:hypothetical protein
MIHRFVLHCCKEIYKFSLIAVTLSVDEQKSFIHSIVVERTPLLDIWLSYMSSSYCPEQLIWRQQSTLTILVLLVTAKYTQRDGKAGGHRSNNILCRGVRSVVTSAHCSCSAYNREVLFWTVGLNRACAERVILISLPSARNEDKWREH